MLSSLADWRTAVLLFSGLGQTMFVLMYVTMPWWKNFLGRALFFNAVAFAVTFDTLAFGRLANISRDTIPFLVIGVVTATGIWAQLIAFIIVRRRGDSL